MVYITKLEKIEENHVCIGFSNEVYWKGHVSVDSNGYYLSIEDDSCNSKIFNELGITDKYTFCENILGYRAYTGAWPYCKTKKDVFKVLYALKDHNSADAENPVIINTKVKHIKLTFNI